MLQAAFVGVKANPQRWTWVSAKAAGEVRLVENDLPIFWTPALCRAYAGEATGANGQGRADPRKGAKTPPEELKARAKALQQQGHSLGEIGRILGISKT